MTVARSCSRPCKPLNAWVFQAEIGSFRLHLATGGKAAKTVRMYTEAAGWFAAAHLLRGLPVSGGSRWTGRLSSGGWCGCRAGTATRTPATSTVPCSSSSGGGDLMHRQALAAQLGDPPAGGVLPRGAFGAGPAGRGEHLHPPGAEVAQQAGHARPRVSGPGAGLGDADPLHEGRAQRLIPALVRLGGRGKELRAGAGSAATREPLKDFCGAALVSRALNSVHN
jgi:hypothetical protein